MDLQNLKQQISHFVDERDWGQFHSPKNLAVGLSVEASEVLEIFQWQSCDESKTLSEDKIAELSDELSDVFFYLIRLSQHFDIDLEQALNNKLKKNIEKYPVSLVKGSPKKYTDY